MVAILPRSANSRLRWTESPFLTDVEHCADGSLILRPRAVLGRYPLRMMDSLEHWAAVTPDSVLVARRGRGDEWVTISYVQMLERVRRVAAGLVARELSADRPIMILSGNSIEHLILAFSATWAGIPYCAVSPAYSQASSDLQRLRHVFELLTPGMAAAFSTERFQRALTEVVPPGVEIVGDLAEMAGRRVTGLTDLEAEPGAALQGAHARTGRDSIVKFSLTSGTTGHPKAVITTERMLCSNARMLHEGMPFLADQPPVILDWLPWNHTFGGSHNVGLVIFNGGSLYIDDGKPTPDGILETVRNLRDVSPTVYFNVPKGFDMLATHLAKDTKLRHSFYRNLQACFFAAASLSQHIWDRLDAAAVAELGQTIPVLSSLGATETGPAITFTTPSTARSGVIGLPAAGNVLKLTPCEGKLEMRVRSPSVTPGYWRQPELTEVAFDADGFYRLGDAVRPLDADDLTKGLMFDGRIAEDFKLASGTWVSVGPLRSSLIAALAPFVQDVVVAGLDRDYLAVLLVPDLRECAIQLNLTELPTYSDLWAHPVLRELLRDRLRDYAEAHPASSVRVRRAVVLPSTPSLDHGEITDKGSVNQRAVLRHRSDLITQLYQLDGGRGVIQVD
jgi:feruloyl-CoA synthase